MLASPAKSAEGGEGVVPAPAEIHDPLRNRKKERKRLKDGRRRPDAWERYRILADIADTGRHLIDLADHKARFALVIMAFLNAVIAFVATRPRVVDAVSDRSLVWVALLLAPYLIVVLGFLTYAVDCLRPRSVQIALESTAATRQARGVLFWEYILHREPDELRQIWGEIRMDEIEAELVLLAHSQAHINGAKYAALRRLYLCLFVMIGLAAVLLAVSGYSVLLANPVQAR